jgi:hypothetical protein
VSSRLLRDEETGESCRAMTEASAGIRAQGQQADQRAQRCGPGRRVQEFCVARGYVLRGAAHEPGVAGLPRHACMAVMTRGGALERGNAVARRDIAFRRDVIPTSTV